MSIYHQEAERVLGTFAGANVDRAADAYVPKIQAAATVGLGFAMMALVDEVRQLRELLAARRDEEDLDT